MRSGRLRSPSSVAPEGDRARRRRPRQQEQVAAGEVAVGEAQPGAPRRGRGGLDRVAPRQGGGQVGVGRHRRQELVDPGASRSSAWSAVVTSSGVPCGAQRRRHRGARSAGIGRHASRAAWRSAAAAGRRARPAAPAARWRHDARDLRRGGERLDDALDHGPAADLDQRLVADAGVLGQRIAAGARAGQHQRGQARHAADALLVDAVGLVRRARRATR